jgi:hypothetical protein
MNYNTGVISKPALLIDSIGTPRYELSNVTIPLNEEGKRPIHSLETTPSLKDLGASQTEDDSFFLRISGHLDHRVPVCISGVRLLINGEPQVRAENVWIDETWRQFAEAIPHRSTQD